MTALRYAIIGAGGIAQSYAQVFSLSTDAEAVVVVDEVRERGTALAERLGCRSLRAYTDVDPTTIDAVLVCTPPITHFEICSHFIAAGVPVLCEKPLAIDTSSAETLVAAADAAGVTFAMAAKFRYCADVIRAKSIVASGILGEIMLFENVFASRVSMGTRWNADPAISGGGVIIDNGTHSVDIVRYFLGPVADVMAVEGKRVQGLPVEDTAQMYIRTVDDVMATVDLSWSIDKEVDSFISIYGSQGTVRVGWKESKYRQVSSPDWVVFGTGYDKLQAMGDQLANFTAAVRGDEKLLISGEDAIASVSVIERAYCSLARTDWVAVTGDGSALPQDSGELVG